MALPALNWRMLAPIVLPAAPTMANVLDAIFTMGNASTYGDGTGRTPGTDSAWSWGRDTTNTNNVGVTTACFGTPPLNPPSGLGIKVLFAGSANGATPVMVTSPVIDSWNINTLLMGLCKNAGTYNNAVPASNLGWRDANPFTTGQFTGFVRASLLVTTQYTLPPVVYMWESQEAVIVMLSGNGGTSVCGAGALLDPMATGALNAEADGRLYCMMTSGGTALVGSSFLSVTTGSPVQGQGAGNAQHFYVCSLGNVTGVRNGFMSNFLYPTATMTYPGGERPLQIIPFTCNSAYSGQLRQIYWSSFGIAGQEYRYGGTTVGYGVGSSNYSAGDLLVLTR
jgi:hypothetical protein